MSIMSHSQLPKIPEEDNHVAQLMQWTLGTNLQIGLLSKHILDQSMFEKDLINRTANSVVLTALLIVLSNNKR